MQPTGRILFLVAAAALACAATAQSGEPGKTQAAADRMHGKAPGEVRDDNWLEMKLVWCPPGSVMMQDVEQVAEPVALKVETAGKPNGDDDDDEVDPKVEPVPQPRVTTRITPVRAFLTRGYWIGKFEVTQAEWKRVMATEPWNGKNFSRVGADIPVTWVNWDDSMAFCRRLTEQEREAGRLPTGWEYTLPTEAQWERACRARTETVFSFGDDESKLGDYAWFRANAMDQGQQFVQPVGRKKPNPWGLCDMHGNVFEWCRDVYAQKLPGGRDPETTGEGPFRIFRGGSWCVEGLYCRSADRSWPKPNRDYAAIGVGLRVALCAVPPNR